VPSYVLMFSFADLSLATLRGEYGQ
jgi:hypothetical protein